VRAPELAGVNQRHHEPGQVLRRGVGAYRSVGLPTPKDLCHRFGHARDALVQGAADAGLEVKLVGIGQEDAKHRRGVNMIEVVGGEVDYLSRRRTVPAPDSIRRRISQIPTPTMYV
jgi:hypothetical protein